MKIARPIFKAVLILLVVSYGSEAFCQNAEPSNGKLKSVIVYTEKNNALVVKKFKESEVYYDQKGNVTEEIYYKEGKVTSHFKYVYDKTGNKIREEEYDPTGKLKEYSEYKIENGQRTEKIVYDPGKTIKLKKTYVYTSY